MFSHREHSVKVCALRFDVYHSILVLFAFCCQIWETIEAKPLFHP
jgi:hypothetical protein